MIYLDNAATTMVSDDVLQKASIYYNRYFGNASSIHAMGRITREAIENSRKIIAKCINAEPDNIIFTSGGSESNSLAITGLLQYLHHTDCSILTTSIEHPSVLNSMRFMEENNIEVNKTQLDHNGYIKIDRLSPYSNTGKRVGLFSAMAVNNELGTTQDLKALGQWCRQNNILFHTDCVQGIDTINIDVQEMNIDLMSVSGHKIHAFKGTGFLYVRNKELLRPIIHGGDQEFGLRAGTENVAGIVGLATAIENVYKTGVSYIKIKEIFVKTIKELFEENGLTVQFNGDSETNHSKIVNLCFPGVDGQTLLLMLDSKSVYVSAGSACKSKSNRPSHVLKAIGLSDEEALSSIRVSFSKYSTVEGAIYAAEAICQAVKDLLL